jgi:hypothetical protein
MEREVVSMSSTPPLNSSSVKTSALASEKVTASAAMDRVCPRMIGTGLHIKAVRS